MTYKLLYPESYIKRARKFLRKHPEVAKQYQKALELIEINPYHPSLGLHRLEGRLKGVSSVSINMSYRIVLEFEIREAEILLVNVGKTNSWFVVRGSFVGGAPRAEVFELN